MSENPTPSGSGFESSAVGGGTDGGDLRSAAPVPTGARHGRLATSLGVVLGPDPEAASAIVTAMEIAGPRGCRLEYLVIDDHGDPRRRELRAVVDSMGDALHLVPRPGGGRAAELDALTTAAASEFVVFCADTEAVGFIDPALSAMWVDGTDAAVVEAGPSPEDPGQVDDPAVTLARALGLAGGSPAVLVVVRRWVARWLLSELDLAVDSSSELADRARLLGFALARLDRQGRRL